MADRAGRVAFGVVAALAFLGVGASAALLLATPTVPHDLAPAADIDDAPVGYEDFGDSRPVDVAFTRALDVTLSAPASGVVTAFECSAGGTFESGTSSLAIDGSPVLSLATAVPPWRDLRPGDTGDDVAALQRELGRLGFAVRADGILGDGSVAAVEELLETASGRELELTSISRSLLLWLPAPSSTTSSCSASLGGPIEAGGGVAVVAGSVASAHIPVAPDTAVDGDRMLAVDDVTLRIPSDGRLVDAADLAAFAGTASVRSALATPGTTTVSAQLALAAPIEVGVVPPSAIVSLDGDTGCVLGDGAALEVRVVGSELGRSSVVFADGARPTDVAIDPDPSTTCR